ncbi:hypothetical protein ACHAXA_003172 [Cyclostephanos tholiformis]|uniref:Ketoreductase (KR) domain-containing protein n=1 Tax=Cyclostephanos tholiformis TaxID=382380 RepID=A0ABD3SSK2_9STRA
MGGGRAAHPPCLVSLVSALLLLLLLLLAPMPLLVVGDSPLAAAIVASSSSTTITAATTTTASQRRRPRTFLITGSTDGIGRHTSRRLAADGHALIVHGRADPTSDAAVTSLLRDLVDLGASRVAYLRADLGDLDQVAGLASDVVSTLRSWQTPPPPGEEEEEEEDDDDDRGVTIPASGGVSSGPPMKTPSLDCLINNAGVFDPIPRISARGYDATMTINVLAPFVLTRLLLPCLVRGNEPRIITTSSVSQSRTMPNLNSLFARRIFDNERREENDDGGKTRDDDRRYDFEPLSPYSAHSLYSHSKLGNLLFTVQLARVLSNYDPRGEEGVPTSRSSTSSSHLLNNLRRIQCLTMDPGTVNTKMLLAGWGPCGISINDANNTYKLATMDEYAYGAKGARSGSYHFGWGMSQDANDDGKLVDFWNKMTECTGVRYDDLSRDCL